MYAMAYAPTRAGCLLVTFGEWLKKQRDERGWTQDVLAAYSDVTKASISRIEQGIQGPRPKTLALLVRGLVRDSEDPDAYESLMREARKASAGIVADDLERIPDEEREEWAGFYEGLERPESRQRLRESARFTYDLLRRLERESSIGGGDQAGTAAPEGSEG